MLRGAAQLSTHVPLEVSNMPTMHILDKIVDIITGGFALLSIRYAAEVAYRALTRHTNDYKEGDHDEHG